ncbi:MAG: nuclear transport factor 2 family protein [Solirubrobacteraceae bacterium]
MGGNDKDAEVVRRSHQAYNDRDRDAFLGCLAEDVVWHVAGGHPLAGTYRGRDGLWQDLMDPLWASPARVFEHQLLEHGDHVVAVVDAVHDFGEGEQRFETVEVFRLDGGRVAERWEFASRQAELDRLFTRGCAAAAGQDPD